MKRRTHTRRRIAAVTLALFALSALSTVAMPAAAGSDGKPATKSFWKNVGGELPTTKNGKEVVIEPESFRALDLDTAALAATLDDAPVEETTAAAAAPLVVSLPAPDGGFQSFRLEESPVMEPELAAKHPEIKTYRGVGIDDPAATVRADLSPLGFHASVRSPSGTWYIDPYYHLDDSIYASYWTNDVEDVHAEEFVEKDDGTGAFGGGEEISALDVPEGPETVLRTYRLAIITNPGYSNYFGGPANVTAAKVALVNRVTQIYEDETSIRMVLIADTEKTNLNTPELATGANGPCGTAPCFTTQQVSSCSGGGLNRNRIVLGQIIGASNYDVGHLALGNPGGGVAGLGVVGGDGKARGCTGLSNPVGDFFAVDYVAHEIGHQFGGSHTFNGTVGSCSGGNRSSANSVEPGSGSSIMAYAGICGSDNLQPHTDPYWSYRSFDQITATTSEDRPPINEVQNASLYAFDTDGDSFRIRYEGNDSEPIVRGVNYNAAGIGAAITGIAGWPAGATVTVQNFGGGGSPSDNGFQVTFGGTLALVNVSQLALVDFVGADGFVGETAKGGPIDNKGFNVQPTGNHAPVATVPASSYTIPVQTPFSLTGSATDSDGDTVTYLWEQTDRGGTTGTALRNNVKLNGPLFRVFGTPLLEPPYVETEYYADGENHPTTDPTRVLPDLVQILDNRTNAATGTCPATDVECFSEFLPTPAYVGFTGVNADPARLNFRLTARDNRGGIGNAAVSLVLAHAAGPFLVTSHGDGSAVSAGSTQTVAWNVAGTDAAPVSVSDVRISLSVDGGLTYPHVLAASTANDGSADVVIPQLLADAARIKVEALGNVFFDLNDASFEIVDTTPPVLTLPDPIVVNATSPSGTPVAYTVTATDNIDPDPVVVCSPPSGSTFPIGTTTVTCTATDFSGNVAEGSFTVHVKGAQEQLEDLLAAVTGLPPGSSLPSKVTGILDKLASGNITATCQRLDAFANEVSAQRGKALTEEQADGFLSDAARIAAVLGCS